MYSIAKKAGFTLLELMIAIAIFAILGIMSAQLLNNMIRQHDIIDARGAQLTALQRAMTIMQRDVGQIWGRSVRDQYGTEILAAVTTEDVFPIEFTRTGWRNPLERARSNLQRVAYEHRDTTLYRYYWPVLDRDIETEPVEQTLMENVLSAEFELLDGNGDAYDRANADLDPSNRTLQVAALNVRLELESYGELSRIWEIPASLDINPSSASHIDGQPGGEGEAADAPGTQTPANSSPGATPGQDISANPPAGDGS